MGLRFKKSIKIAPGVKINLNKKSASVTLGGKGLHHTISSNGTKTTSAGIPGTGLSYSKTASRKTEKIESSKQSSSGTVPSKKKKRWIPIVIILLVLCVLGSLMTENKPKSITLSADSSQIYEIGSQVPISVSVEPAEVGLAENAYKSSGGNIKISDGTILFSSDIAGSFDVWAECDTVKSNTLTFVFEDNTEETVEMNENEESQTQESQEQMVWISSSGNKYHKSSDCSGMENPTQVTLSEAQNMGLEACKKCY